MRTVNDGIKEAEDANEVSDEGEEDDNLPQDENDNGGGWS